VSRPFPPPRSRPRRRVGGPLFAALVSGLAASAAAGCRENLSTLPSGVGPGTLAPALSVSPERDTTVDSTGVLRVRVQVDDRVRLRLVSLQVLDATFTFSPVAPFDTTLDAAFSFPLDRFKHSSFRYYARASNILDHETVSDTVTVTVR